MNPAPIFAIQFVWFLVAWFAVAFLLVLPRLRKLPAADALAVAIAPQMFRALGLGLLVPALAPDMPRSFAVPTAVGDALTSVLAVTAVVSLTRRYAIARAAAWTCTVVGSADLAIALPHAALIGAAEHLAGQWYVPTLCVPLMVVSHAVTLRILLMADDPR